MAAEDDFLRRWVNQLKTLYDCVSQNNTDADPDLAKFCAQKHADLLKNDEIKQTVSATFQNRTGITLNDDHFTNCSTFRELLDHAYRPLQQAVIVVMRAVAVSHDATLSATPEETFGTVSTAKALPAALIDELSGRLEAAMSPLFKPDKPSKTKLSEAVSKPGANVQAAAQAIL